MLLLGSVPKFTFHLQRSWNAKTVTVKGNCNGGIQHPVLTVVVNPPLLKIP